MTQVYTVKEVAEKLRIGIMNVYGLCAANRIAHARMGKGRGKIRISEEALAEFMRDEPVVVKKPEVKYQPRRRKAAAEEACPVMDQLYQKYQQRQDAAG